jgi:predicted SAM-dependent methyltransferase
VSVPARQRVGAIGRRTPVVRGLFRARERRRERHELEWDERDRQLVEELRGRTDLRLNVGSYSNHLGGWIDIDLNRDPAGRCFRMDATKPWPFGAGAAEAVNSEHFIEHLEPADARAYLHEAYAALRPGGVIRTSTPSLRGLTEMYLEGDAATLAAHRGHGYEAATHGAMLNNYFYLWGHRQIYDFETLAGLLGAAGFESVEQVSYGQSRHDPLRGIDRHDSGAALERATLYVDAVKPAR